MKHTINISTYFPKHLFWDMDIRKLNPIRDKDIIIPRAFFATTKETFESDLTKLESIYSKEEIVTCLMNTKERISNLVCEMISKKYNVTPFFRFKQ